MNLKRSPIVVIALWAMAPAFAFSSGGDAHATQLLAGAVRSLNGSTTLTDLSLSAQANYTAGSDEETGTATLKAKGDLQSLVELALNSGPRREIRSDLQGEWSGTDTLLHPMAFFNCFTPAAWFAPNLLLPAVLTDSHYSFTVSGTEQFNGEQVEHLQITRTPGGDETGDLTKLSAADLYLDSSSLLPVGISFSQHPDRNSLTNLAVLVLFSKYQTFSGVQVATQITKFFQGVPLLQVTVSSTSVNSGLADGTFAISNQAERGAGK